MSEAVILSIVSLVSSCILGYFAYLNNRDKIRLDAELATLKQTVCDQQGEINDLKTANGALNGRNDQLEKKNTLLWSYLISNMENQIKRGVPMPPPPVELRSDPQIVRIMEVKPRKTKVGKKK